MGRHSTWKEVRSLVVVLAIALGAAGAALAHQGHEHEQQGTIKSIEATKLELTTTEGPTVVFVTDEATKFLRGTSPVKRDEVQVGERAVVKYHVMGEMRRAFEVKLAEKRD